MKDFKFYTERDLRKLTPEHLNDYYIMLYTQMSTIHRLFPYLKKELKKEIYKSYTKTYKIKLHQPVFCKCCNKEYGGYYNYIQHCKTKGHIKNSIIANNNTHSN